jgi:hypothetical protein
MRELHEPNMLDLWTAEERRWRLAMVSLCLALVACVVGLGIV